MMKSINISSHQQGCHVSSRSIIAMEEDVDTVFRASEWSAGARTGVVEFWYGAGEVVRDHSCGRTAGSAGGELGVELAKASARMVLRCQGEEGRASPTDRSQLVFRAPVVLDLELVGGG